MTINRTLKKTVKQVRTLLLFPSHKTYVMNVSTHRMHKRKTYQKILLLMPTAKTKSRSKSVKNNPKAAKIPNIPQIMP